MMGQILTTFSGDQLKVARAREVEKAEYLPVLG